MDGGDDSGPGRPKGSPARTPSEDVGNGPTEVVRAEGRGEVLVERARVADGESGLAANPRGGLGLFLAGHGLRALLTAGQWRHLAARASAIAERIEADGETPHLGTGEEAPPPHAQAGGEREEDLGEAQERLRLICPEWGGLQRRLMLPGGAPLSPEEELRLWTLTATAIDLFATAFDDFSVSNTGHPSTQSDMLHFAAAGIIETLQGSTPRAWRPQARTGKRPPRTPTALQRVGIAFAAAYYKAVDEGLFTDERPNKTVRERYGVKEGTVQLWAKSDPGEKYQALRERVLAITGPESQIDTLRREDAQKALTAAGHLYKRRVL